MRFQLGCRLTYRIPGETAFLFNIEAQPFDGQRIIAETLSLTPEVAAERWTMPESGNRYFRAIVPSGTFTVAYEATVEAAPVLEDATSVTEVPMSELPLSVLTHLNPSRYCQSDRLGRFAQATFGALPSGYTKVHGICEWIHDYVAYEGGVSNAMTSAFDTVTQRAGVCRDFAHLAIACCRALGIPARYVSAYAYQLDPPDFHAVFEAWLAGPTGSGWYLFDPTRLAEPSGLVRIGIGRDAADVAFCTPFGAFEAEKPEVWITADRPVMPAGTQAVRTTKI